MKAKILTPHKTPRLNLGELVSKKKIAIRLGASGKSKDPENCIVLNPIAAVKSNADKLNMKEKFKEAGIKSPEFVLNDEEGRKLFKEKGWNVVYKRKNHSGGVGMKFYSIDEIDNHKESGILERRIVPKREFRIHCIPALNAFFAVEKLRKKDKLDQLARNLENCVFVQNFEKPANWQEALDETKKALEVMGLDFGCADVAQTKKGFYIIETNSGPGMGSETGKWYTEELQKLINLKTQQN